MRLVLLLCTAGLLLVGIGGTPIDRAWGIIHDGGVARDGEVIDDGRVIQDSGIIEGTVRLPAVRGEPPSSRSPYARRRYRPPSPSASATTSPRQVVVFVSAADAEPALADTTVRITQRDETIIPHVTAIQAGTTVEFPNEDDVYHNLFSLSSPHTFNLGRYPPGESRSEVFRSPGVVRMFCDIHSNMSAVIRVVETPYFTRPDESGRYRIEGLPPGRHRVVAWHDAARPDTTEVIVSASEVTRVDFDLDG